MFLCFCPLMPRGCCIWSGSIPLLQPMPLHLVAMSSSVQGWMLPGIALDVAMFHSWKTIPVSSRYSKSTLCVCTPGQGIEVYIREVQVSAHWEWVQIMEMGLGNSAVMFSCHNAALVFNVVCVSAVTCLKSSMWCVHEYLRHLSHLWNHCIPDACYLSSKEWLSVCLPAYIAWLPLVSIVY